MPTFKLLASWAVAVSIGFGAEPDLLNLVMPDSRILIGVRFDRLKASAAGQMAYSQMNADPQLRAFVAATGFDPRRDLDEVLVAGVGGSPDAPVLLLMRGRFQTERLTAFAQRMGGSLSAFQGVRILVSPKKDAGVLAVLGDSVLLAGARQAVEGAITLRQRPEGISPKLGAKVDALRRRFDIWAVSLGSPAMLAAGVPDPDMQSTFKNSAISAIEEFSAGAQLGRSLQIAGEIRARTEKDAADLANALRFLTGLFQMKAQGPRPGEPMELTVEARTVKFSLTIPPEQLAQAMLQAATRTARKAEVPQTAEPTIPIPPRNTTPTITSFEGSVASVPSSKDANVVVLPAPKAKP